MTKLRDNVKRTIRERINLGFANADYEFGFLTAMHTVIDYDVEYALRVGPTPVTFQEALSTVGIDEQAEAAYSMGYHGLISMVGT